MPVVSKMRRARGAKVEYPVIMEYMGTIVLFTAPKIGTVISSGREDNFGEHRTDWGDVEFVQWRRYDGSIILENIDGVQS